MVRYAIKHTCTYTELYNLSQNISAVVCCDKRDYSFGQGVKTLAIIVTNFYMDDELVNRDDLKDFCMNWDVHTTLRNGDFL